MPTEAEDFALASARIVAEHKDRLEITRQLSMKSQVFMMLKETLPYIVLPEHRNIGYACDLRRCHFRCEVEHTLQRSQFTIDAPIARTLV